MKFSCDCRKVVGEIDRPDELVGFRFVCMCRDCQKFMQFLGKTDSELDRNAGTEVVPVFPKLIKIAEGMEHIKGIKLSEKNDTFRWYAGCCNSPIANSLSSKQGYIGLITKRLALEDRDRLGPIRVRANGDSGIGPLPHGTAKGFPVQWAFVTVYMIARMYITGWKQPHPFFNRHHVPYIEPEILQG